MSGIDLARRQAVMARSQKLGHCICDPQHPCPCPPLLEANICPCAGERAPTKHQDAALTRHVRKAGCASKIGQADLLQILAGLPEVTDPNVLAGVAAGDDAAIYRLDEEQSLVQTVDVFTPCVDDPYLFGQIAAANSVSDVYAMGGRPLTALSIVGFPIDTLDGSIMQTMLRGGIDKLAEAGCPVVGGHSVNEEEIKCGFAITGLISTARAVLRDRVEPGDVLVLTKPLGTGMLSFAAQLGVLDADILAEAGAWMAQLNKDAAECMAACEAHACTDITGYGLAGHLLAMARGSGVHVEIDLASIPVFAMIPECIRQDVFGGAVDRNQAYAMGFVDFDGGYTSEGVILFDPQTSGGLLVALPEPKAAAFQDAMHARGHEETTIIGRAMAPDTRRPVGRIRVCQPELANLVGIRRPLDMSHMRPESTPETDLQEVHVACCESPPDLPSCCDAPPRFDDEPNAPNLRQEDVPMAENSLDTFKAFMKEANTPGLIDGRNKKLMAIVLSIAHHCEPCLRTHLEGAKQMGIPKAEVEEAANLAIAFGGCTAMMFFQETCRAVGY